MGFLYTILDFFFPARCFSCGKTGVDLCSDCLAQFPGAEYEGGRESADWIFSIYDYRYPKVKQAVWLLKYKGKRGLSKVFAESIYARMLEELADLKTLENFTEPLLVPIPLSATRMRERRFNQAELIARELVNLDGQNKNLTLETDILTKPQETEHQARIENRATRMKNVVGSFGVKNENKFAGRNIILIDDVTTTGATLHEAKKVLQNAGTRKVVAFTFAH